LEEKAVAHIAPPVRYCPDIVGAESFSRMVGFS